MERNIPGMAVGQRLRVATAEIKTAQKRVMGFFFDIFRAYALERIEETLKNMKAR